MGILSIVGSTGHRGLAVADRQPQGEGRALALPRLDLDPAAVVVSDMADDGQAEAGAAGVAGPRPVDPVEPLEDPAEVAGGDADAVVAHGHGDRAALPLDLDLD